MNQVHITEPTPLPDENGVLVQPGYATHMPDEQDWSHARGFPLD